MGKGNLSNIGILVFQTSIVIRGIEKRLSDEGYQVGTLVNDFKRVGSIISETDLFIIYLPDGISDDSYRIKVLQEVCETIMGAVGKMIIIGAKKEHEGVKKRVPHVNNFKWIDLPLDMEYLCNCVSDIFAEPQTSPVSKHILIIDDDPAYAKIVREWIKDKYKVSIVTAGMQALTFLFKNKVDLILLDYEMPIVNGPQVLQMIRSDDELKKIPVIFLTGVGTPEEVNSVMKLKPDGYILKSTSRENLIKYLNVKLYEK
ncbi:MAG: response regulator [Lachnospiraceae bacterium]|nr:response regulator [Lachnospiraceae bacterium]